MQSHPLPKTLIIITGPTASGKTGVAIDVAKKFDTEIISADSRQCFKELNIGVARPSPDQLSQVPHHFIASHSIEVNITAAYFEEYALRKAKELFSGHDVIVMVGGTGLYIKAFCEGLDKIPAIDPVIRERVVVNYNHKGIDWLKEELESKDPTYSEKGEMKNPQRMMRALEVIESTGQSILSFRNTGREKRDFNIVKYGIQISREELHRNIDSRVDQMLQAGLVEEARPLLPFRNLNALQTVGYKELFDFFESQTTLAVATALIKQNTRQYAKRQLTWFRREGQVNWLPAAEITSAVLS